MGESISFCNNRRRKYMKKVKFCQRVGRERNCINDRNAIQSVVVAECTLIVRTQATIISIAKFIHSLWAATFSYICGVVYVYLFHSVNSQMHSFKRYRLQQEKNHSLTHSHTYLLSQSVGVEEKEQQQEALNHTVGICCITLVLEQYM